MQTPEGPKLKRLKPEENPNFCIAPWTHTYISPQSERRLCCASREKHDFARQYLDQNSEVSGDAVYQPKTLKEHWNSDHMKSVRRRMLAGETLPECEVCNHKSLNLFTYRKYFTSVLFPQHVEKAFLETDDTGATTMEPISFDYRISNLCNFKCRMCGEQLSSAWEQEKRTHGELSPLDLWAERSLKSKISEFQNTVVVKELEDAVERQTVEELYWVGGEPLLWDEHWQVMKRIVELGYAHKVYARYNTNLNRIEHHNTHLFKDILSHFSDYNICASIDAAGKVGEFIRTGLNWEQWLKNFETGVSYKNGREDSIVMDVTLTLPGLFGMKELFDKALELDVKMYVKVMYAFDASVVLSPLAPPRAVLHPILDDLIAYCEPRQNWKTAVLVETLKDLKNRPTFDEEWPENYQKGFQMGRDWMQRLGSYRKDGHSGRLTIEDIYSMNPQLLEWWKS